MKAKRFLPFLLSALVLVAVLVVVFGPPAAADDTGFPPQEMHVLWGNEHSCVLAAGWVEGTELALAVERGGVEVYSETGVAGAGLEPGETNRDQYTFMVDTEFRLERGDVVTTTGAGITKTHQITDLTIGYVDPAGDTVHGSASTATQVEVYVWPNSARIDAPVIDGTWVADFSGVHDITLGTHLMAMDRDEDGDVTQIDYPYSSHHVNVICSEDGSSVAAWNCAPGTDLLLTVERGGVEVYSETGVASSYDFLFLQDGDFEIERGDLVTVSGGGVTKTLQVADLTLDGWDFDSDMVWGTSPTAAQVDVEAETPGGSYARISVPVVEGVWAADFSGIVDITPESAVSAIEWDEDLDSTQVPWAQPAPNQPPVAMLFGPFIGLVDRSTSFVSYCGDPEGGPLTYSWDWGDGTCSPDAGPTPTHVFTAVGIYHVCLTVTDSAGATASAYADAIICDPKGGFVTGGGWFTSPRGAYLADPSVTGKANFGFVVRYKKGDTDPSGNVEFQLKVADLKFKSTGFAFLLVNGANAWFLGFGTINGQGTYLLNLSVVDGDAPGGGGADRLWMRIVDMATWTPIYDTHPGDAGNPPIPSTELGGGSIVIHR